MQLANTQECAFHQECSSNKNDRKKDIEVQCAQSERSVMLEREGPYW